MVSKSFSLTSLTLLVLCVAKSAPMKSDERIVHGQEVEPHSVPYMVHGGMFRCGGSILNEVLLSLFYLLAQYTILTAAHCRGWELIYAGDHDKTVTEATEQVIEVLEEIDHEGFPFDCELRVGCDFGILKLAEPLLFNEAVQPIALPIEDVELRGKAWTYGWGTDADDNYQDRLHGVQVDLVSYEECAEAYGDEFEVSNHICAGGAEGDSCGGDSGGPLVCKNDEGQDFHCGITSWGRDCADDDYPGVYARTAAALSFIHEHL